VFFDFDKTALPDDAQATLGRQAAWLEKYQTVDVLIAGNADERGTETYNLALGERRAGSKSLSAEASPRAAEPNRRGFRARCRRMMAWTSSRWRMRVSEGSIDGA
jgi:hypothetical protein